MHAHSPNRSPRTAGLQVAEFELRRKRHDPRGAFDYIVGPQSNETFLQVFYVDASRLVERCSRFLILGAYRHEIDHSLSRLLLLSFTLVEREEYWQTERLWFKKRLGGFAPVSKQLTLKPGEMRSDPQLTASSYKTDEPGAGQ